MKHDVTRCDRSSAVRVRFNEKDANNDRKSQDADSTENTDSTPESSEKENYTGVTTRSMARLHEPIPDSAAPSKSSLKKKSQ